MLLWPAVSMAIILLSCPPPSSLCFRFWHPFHWCQLASSEILSDRAQQWYVLCVTLVKGYCLVCAASFCLSDSIFQCLFDVDFWLIVCFVIEVTGLINSSKIRCHSRSHVFVTVLHRQPKEPHTSPDNHTQPQRQGEATNPEHPEIPDYPKTATRPKNDHKQLQGTPANPNNPKQPKQLNPRNSDTKQTQNSKQK